MRRVLFAWELGDNLGHAIPLARLARSLQDGSTEITVAGRDLRIAAHAFRDIAGRVLQAPHWPPHRHLGNEETQGSYLDILARIGFGDARKLGVVADAWKGLIDLVQPDLIVADHCPGLQFATYGGGIPVMAIGTGFTMPPLDYGFFPPLQADRAPIVNEGDLLTRVTTLLEARERPAPASLPELFATEERFVFGCPELDPYRAFRREPLIDPPDAPLAVMPPPVEPRLFAYLGPGTPALDVVVQVLAEIDVGVTVYLRGDDGMLSDFLALRGHEVHREPPSFAQVLPRVSHVLSTGGFYTSYAAYATGRPQLVIPQHNESFVNLSMLESMGVAARLEVGGEPRDLMERIRSFIENHAFLQTAQARAAAMSQRGGNGRDIASVMRRRLDQMRPSTGAPGRDD